MNILQLLAQAIIATFVLAIIALMAGLASLVAFHMLLVWRGLRGGLGTIGREEEWCKEEKHKGLSLEELGRLGGSCCDINIYGGNEFDCVICLERCGSGERFRVLHGCGHCFHAECVDFWLVKSAICPICRGIVRCNS